MINDTTMIKERRRNRERSSSHSANTTCSESTTGLRGGEGGAGIPRSTKGISPTSAMVIKTQEQSLQCNGIHKRHRQPIIDRSTRVHTCSSVDFSHATVRLHFMILGDNPACTDGPPITISWNCNQELTYAIPRHNEVKCQNDIKKVPDDLQLTSEERIDILQSQGFTFGEIQRCILKTNCERAERMETLKQLTQRNVLARFKNFLTPKREKKKSKEGKIATNNT